MVSDGPSLMVLLIAKIFITMAGFGYLRLLSYGYLIGWKLKIEPWSSLVGSQSNYERWMLYGLWEEKFFYINRTYSLRLDFTLMSNE